jgi:hypothetical protein
MDFIVPPLDDDTRAACVRIKDGKFFYAEDEATAKGDAENWVELNEKSVRPQPTGGVLLMVPTMKQSQS